MGVGKEDGDFVESSGLKLRANTKVWGLGQRLELEKEALGATDWLEVEK